MFGWTGILELYGCLLGLGFVKISLTGRLLSVFNDAPSGVSYALVYYLVEKPTSSVRKG